MKTSIMSTLSITATISSKCNWCNKTVNSLTTLSCSHQFCLQCTHKLFLFNYNTLLLNFKEELSLMCLHCQKGELKTTRSLIHQICSETNSLEPNNKPICQNHKKEEEVFCKDCRALMCQECFDQHKLIRAFSFHNSIEYLHQSKVSICSKHNKILDYQCIKCSIPICEVCKSLEHEDHRMDVIEGYYEKKKDLLKYIRLPYKTFEECTKYIDKEEIVVKEAISKESNNLVDQIQSMIDSLIQNKEEIVSNAKQLEKEATVNFKITRTVYETLYKELENLSSEDYLNINMLWKLPEVDLVPTISEQVNESLLQGLKEIKVMIDRLKAYRHSHFGLEINKLYLNYNANAIVYKEIEASNIKDYSYNHKKMGYYDDVVELDGYSKYEYLG